MERSCKISSILFLFQVNSVRSETLRSLPSTRVGPNVPFEKVSSVKDAPPFMGAWSWWAYFQEGTRIAIFSR
ncbi:hypothetical protein DY000_02024901 [Brassica cretica]|uniref:Uncharacterized protein n=1 Tax=Brassica cretica TaxID=69181 RepID=A0ABQ7EF33_BRACR|nr:hypothetical protein DY000_02024901 [Brassica cretica]